VEDINKIWNTIKKKGINDAAGKLIGKEEGPQRNSWFDEKWQIILEHKKTAYTKMINRNTRQTEQEHRNKRKVACEIFRHKIQYCLNQSWSQ